MENACTTHTESDQPPARACCGWSGVAAWLSAGVLVGLAVGWIATLVAVRFAPLVLFPLAVGAVLGIVLTGLSRFFQSDYRQTIVAAAVVASFVAIGAQHYFSYSNAAREMTESKTINDAKAAFAELMQERLPSGPLDYLRKQAAIGRPMPFGYVARGPMAWLSWAVDSLLLFAGAMAVVVFAGAPKETDTRDHQHKEMQCPT